MVIIPRPITIIIIIIISGAGLISVTRHRSGPKATKAIFQNKGQKAGGGGGLAGAWIMG